MALARALETLPPEIVTSSATSAFPPLGIALIALDAMAWLPRTVDNKGVRPVRIGGRMRDPAAIAIAIALAGLLLYPVAGMRLRVGGGRHADGARI